VKVRKFFAPTSREALRLVREALGADAVVLSNRVVDGGVELVALTEENLTDWVDDGGTTHMDNGTLPSWDQAFSSDSDTSNAHAPAPEQVRPTARPVQATPSPAATGSWRDLPRDQPASPTAQRTPLTSKGTSPASSLQSSSQGSSSSRPSQFPWRDAPPRSQTNRAAREDAFTPARSLASDVSSGVSASAGRRDRTVALPGVLAAGAIADDGVSALAYKHRGLRGDEASTGASANAAKPAAPYNSLSIYADGTDGSADEVAPAAGHGMASAPRGTAAYAQPDAGFTAADAAEDETDVVWKPSGRVAPAASTSASTSSAPQRASAAVTAFPGAATAAGASTFVPFTAASVRTPDAPQLASESSVPATGASETTVPNADHAAALMKTNESKRSATRSIFARIFSRQSSTERDTVAASESAAAAMSRLEKRGDEDASVLGLQRAERRDETAEASASSSSPRRDVPLSASSAAARGMGTASAPIVVRPTATREEALLAQQPASATLPQEARAMYESDMYPQQDFVQQDFAQTNASADNPAYAPLHEPIETPSYPEGFSPQDFEAAIVAVRNAEAAGMNDLPYRENELVENVADNAPAAPAAPVTALNANLSADVTTHNASYTNAHAGVEAAVEAVAAAAVESRIASDIPAFVEAPNIVAAATFATAPTELSSPAPVNETKPSGMSFGPAHYTAQTRLKGMSTGQSTGHGVPFLHVAPNLQGAVHTPAFESASASATSTAAPASFVAPAQAEVAADVAPQAALVQASKVETISAAPVAVTAPVSAPVSDAPIFTANDVPAIDLGEVAEVMAATQTVEAANLMETAHTSREAEAATVTTASAAPAPAPATATPFSATPSAAATPASEANHPRVIAGKVLSEMRTLCGTLGEQLDALESQSTVRPDPTRVAMTRMLLGCGFSAQLVRLLLARMPVVADAEQGLAWVKATFERNLPVLDNEDALMEQGGVFALMGPTGVGKTTTTAKLAARAVMRHGADRVALLTTDSYRIGAHEQLRIYGRILGVAVHAVKDAADLSLVLSELRNKHMVLIDTIGMSQRDRAVSEQVSMLCGSHLPVKRLLLLNATSHGDTLNEVVRAYGTRDGSNGAASGLSGCIITKVDESHGIGAALDTVMRHRLPVHYVSNGQKVPEDLRVARRGFLIDNAFSERHRASPFQPDEDDLSMIFGEEGEAASMLSSGAGLTSASSANASNAASAVAQASEAHYG